MTKSYNILKFPLMKILGSELSIRILRLLCTDVPMTSHKIAKMEGLSPTGVKNAMAVLEDSGIILGEGSYQIRYQLNENHPLTSSIKQLFESEAHFFSNLKEKLSQVLKAIDGLDSTWIDSKSLETNYDGSVPLVIWIYTESPIEVSLLSNIRENLKSIELSYNISIELRTLSEPDVSSLTKETLECFENGISLSGPPPLLISAKIIGLPLSAARLGVTRSHADIDKKNLEDGQLVYSHIESDRGLIKEGLAYIKEKIAKSSLAEREELEKWRRLLESGSLKRLRYVLCSESDEPRRMRQSSPFREVLKRLNSGAKFK